MTGTNGPKKAVSERRRQQNRQAQKNYRTKQNRRLRTLEAAVELRGGLYANSAARTEQSLAPQSTLASWETGNSTPDEESLQPPSQLSLSLPRGEAWATARNVAFPPLESASQPQLRAITSFIASKSSDPLRVSTSASSLATSHDLLSRLLQEDDGLDNAVRCRIVSGTLTVEEILIAGVRAISNSISSQQNTSISKHCQVVASAGAPGLRTDKILVIENRMQQHAHSVPDLYANCIRIMKLSSVAAIRSNAEVLGINFEQLCDEDTESPFHDSALTESTDNIACNMKFQHISMDLRPTTAQLKHRHHPWIDTLPSPTLRQRLVECLAMDPPMFEEEEFCQDLDDEGLVCWGSMRGGTDLPSGSGAPWDVRSWEAQPWFLRKWWFVLGGSTGELFQSSKWWNEMRGDSLRPAWK